MRRPSYASVLSHLVTVSDLAQTLSVSKSLVYRWVEEKNIPHKRFGRAIRFDVFEVKEWLKTKSVRPTSISESYIEGDKNNTTRDSRPLRNENLELDVDRILKSTSIRGLL